MIAENLGDARAQFIDAMERDHADRGLTDATARAAETVRGLVNDGPVRLVQTERARLTGQVARAEQRAVRFEDAAARYAALKHAEQDDTRQHDDAIAHAQESAERTRQVVTEEVLALAHADGRTLTTVRADLHNARYMARSAGFGRRRTTGRTADTAAQHLATIEQQVTATWDTAPAEWESVTEWANKIATQRADVHPAVREAEQGVADAQTEAKQAGARHMNDRDRLTVEVYGIEQARQMWGTLRIPNPRADAERARKRATEARHMIAELDARSISEAAQWLTQRQEQQRAEREALEARRTALAQSTPSITRTGPDQQRRTPGLHL